MKKTGLKVFMFILCSFVMFQCDDEETPKSSAKEVLTFNFDSTTPSVSGVINKEQKKIELVVPAETSVTALAPTIEISEKATISPASGVAQDFTSPVTYTVTAEDGSTATYTVTVSIAKTSDKRILSFKFSALTPEVVGVIDETTKKVSLTLPEGNAVNALVPTIQVSGKAKISPASGVVQDFTSPVSYTVTAEDGSTQIYTVSVDVTKSSLKQITSFKIVSLNPQVAGVINQAEKKISLVVPHGTPVTALSPEIAVSPKASVSPGSGTSKDFTSPVTYVVTAEDGSTQSYIVTVTIAEAPVCLPSRLPGEESYRVITYNEDHTIKQIEYLDFDVPEPGKYVQQFHYTNGKLTRIDYTNYDDHITLEHQSAKIIERHFEEGPVGGSIINGDIFVYYLENDRIKGRARYNGTTLNDSIAYTYNAAGNITHADGYDASKVKIETWDYEYDNKGNVYKVGAINDSDHELYIPRNISSNNVTKLIYTDLSGSSSYTEITAYTYDANGKVLTIDADWDSEVREVPYTCN